MIGELFGWDAGGRGIFMMVVLAIMAIEASLIVWVLKRRYNGIETLTSFGVAIGNALTRPFNRAVMVAVLSFFAAFAPWQLPLDQAWAWAVGFIAVEFGYYWMHRLDHTVRWMWSSHSVHHTATHFTLPAAIRLGWTNAFSGEWLVFVPLVLMGVPPVMIGLLLAINLTYQFFLHTEVSPKWGVLEYVLNTPAHHRIHHASNAAYLDKNFGGMLIVFDRLFGTFARDNGNEPVRFGLTEAVTSNNPVVIALGQWVRLFGDAAKAKSTRSLMGILFGPPGSRESL